MKNRALQRDWTAATICTDGMPSNHPVAQSFGDGLGFGVHIHLLVNAPHSAAYIMRCIVDIALASLAVQTARAVGLDAVCW